MKELSLVLIFTQIKTIFKQKGGTIVLSLSLPIIFSSCSLFYDYIKGADEFIMDGREFLFYAILSYFVMIYQMILINHVMDQSKISNWRVLKISVLKLPRYLKGSIIYLIIFLGIIIVPLIPILVISILLGNVDILIYALFTLVIISLIFTKLKFPFINIVLCIENKTNFIKRSKELYKLDKWVNIKFACIIILLHLFVFSLSAISNLIITYRNMYLVIRIALTIIANLATVLSIIIGLTIYRELREKEVEG
ncbi:hypothetical protein [Vallitalea okinawensis]|uniref:hypothetical protein n=1 Tax=Vallitalea okinawensis TaxID=2078660 RepID=UPI000CFC85FC|nr:hypothetical protein [Vallitalea okinawensis]